MIRRLICPALTASRYSAMASICQLCRYALPGSNTGQARRKKTASRSSARAAHSASRSAGVGSFGEKAFKRGQVLVGEAGQVGPAGDRQGPGRVAADLQRGLRRAVDMAVEKLDDLDPLARP